MKKILFAVAMLGMMAMIPGIMTGNGPIYDQNVQVKYRNMYSINCLNGEPDTVMIRLYIRADQDNDTTSCQMWWSLRDTNGVEITRFTVPVTDTLYAGYLANGRDINYLFGVFTILAQERLNMNLVAQ